MPRICRRARQLYPELRGHKAELVSGKAVPFLQTPTLQATSLLSQPRTGGRRTWHMGEGGTCSLYGFPSVPERCPSTLGSNRCGPETWHFPPQIPDLGSPLEC